MMTPLVEQKIRNILKTHCSKNPEGIILRRLLGNKDIDIEELIYLFTELMPEIKLDIKDKF